MLVEGEGAYNISTDDFVYSIWKEAIIKAGNLALYLEIVKDERMLIRYSRCIIFNPDLVDGLRRVKLLNNYGRRTFYVPGRNGYIDYPIYKEAIKLGYLKKDKILDGDKYSVKWDGHMIDESIH